MAEHPKVEALWQNICFIQESMATGGLSTIAGHLIQLDLITRQNYYDLATCGRGPVDQAAMLMRTVEVRIRDNPDVYFTRFIEALRRSHLGNVADRLVQALPEDQRHSTCKCVIGEQYSSLPLMHYQCCYTNLCITIDLKHVLNTCFVDCSCNCRFNLAEESTCI